MITKSVFEGILTKFSFFFLYFKIFEERLHFNRLTNLYLMSFWYFKLYFNPTVNWNIELFIYFWSNRKGIFSFHELLVKTLIAIRNIYERLLRSFPYFNAEKIELSELVDLFANYLCAYVCMI